MNYVLVMAAIIGELTIYSLFVFCFIFFYFHFFLIYLFLDLDVYVLYPCSFGILYAIDLYLFIYIFLFEEYGENIS